MLCMMYCDKIRSDKLIKKTWNQVDGRRMVKILLSNEDDKIVDADKPYFHPQDLHICPDGNHHYTSKNQKRHDFNIDVTSLCIQTEPQGTIVSISGTADVRVFNDRGNSITTSSSIVGLSIATPQKTSSMIYLIYSKSI